MTKPAFEVLPFEDWQSRYEPEFGPPVSQKQPIQIRLVKASSFAEKDTPERPWLVKGMIPHRTVTILGGDGGVGKSLLAKQLAVATATGTDWVGTLPEPGPVLYLSAEDDLDEVHRRLADIVASQGRTLAELDDLHILPLAGRDAVLGAPQGRSGLIEGTPLWDALVDQVGDLGPRLIILDNLADVFAGNENSRPEARQFVGLLRGLAVQHDLTVLLISHPSLSGLNSGTGTSGSTAWSNSVRSRLYLDRAKAEDDSEPDPALRVLKVMKANYAETGEETRLRWKDGAFRLDGMGTKGFDRLAADAKADRVFLALLERLTSEGREVSHKGSPSFAPKVFAEQPDREGCSRTQFKEALNRLMAAKRIRSEPYGPPSRNYSRLVICEAEQ